MSIIKRNYIANEKNINRSATMSASYTGAEKDASVKVFQDRVSKREDIFAMYTNSDIPYRIPAIAVTPTGIALKEKIFGGGGCSGNCASCGACK